VLKFSVWLQVMLYILKLISVKLTCVTACRFPIIFVKIFFQVFLVYNAVNIFLGCC